MHLLMAALLVLLPGLVEAQSRRASRAEPPAATLPPIGLPLPPIGLPLPEIGLPLPPLGLASPGTPTTSRPSPRPPHQGRRPRGKGRPGPDVIYVVPAYGYYGYGWDAAGDVPPVTATTPGMTTAPAPEPPPSTGTLWLDVEPRGIGEVYVDGYLVGTADDLRGAVRLEAGPHRIEVRAPGYETLQVDVRIDAEGAITFRRTLQPTAAPPAAAAAPAGPAPTPVPRKPFYFIPGCYLGDVPPQDAKLPAGCDPGKATVVRP